MAVKAGCGGGTDGLCCRMVIRTTRVFDGCAVTDSNITLGLETDETLPAGARFVSARVVSTEFVTCSVSDGGGGCCRVLGEVTTRFAVTYSDGGVCRTVLANYREQREFLLRLPNGGLVPYSIDAQSVMSVSSGAIAGSAVTVTGCLHRTISVTAPVDILVPTYGYCKYPPCTGCVCDGSFAARVFPFYDNDGSEGN